MWDNLKIYIHHGYGTKGCYAEAFYNGNMITRSHTRRVAISRTISIQTIVDISENNMDETLSGVSSSPSLPVGVEENEASRFVDYTCVTPWESLVRDIEQAIKSYISKSPDTSAKISRNSDISSSVSTFRPTTSSSPEPSTTITSQQLTYDDHKFTIALEDRNESVLISKWFNVLSPYFIICHKGEWRNDSDPSSRHTFFSAAITALSNINTSYPILFIPATRMNLDRSINTLGYRIYRFPSHPRLPYAAITHYESTTEAYYDHITAYNHPLFYLDAAYEQFLSRVSRYYVSSEVSDKSTGVEVIEQYNCATTSLKYMAVYQHNEASFIPRDQSWLISSLQRQSQSLRQAMKYQAMMKSSTSSELIDVDHDVDGYNSNNHDSILSSLTLEAIKSLEVNLAYRGTRQDFRVDNKNYTTMHPSKQPPSAWSADASFTHQSPSTKALTDTQHQQIIYGHDYTIMLRNLIANYIISRSTIASVSIINLFNLHLKPKDLINKDRARSIAAILSPATKDLVDELMNRIASNFHQSQRHPDVISPHNRDIIYAKFMKHLFASAVDNRPSIDDLTGWRNGSFTGVNISITSMETSSDSLASKLYPTVSSEDDADVLEQPALMWTSLLALFAANLEDGLWSISPLWNHCIQHLREHWDTDQALSYIHAYALITPTTSAATTSSDTAILTLDSLHESLKPAASNMLFKRTLWDDMISLLHQQVSWRDLSLPNHQLSSFNQKLQMLQFCVAVKNQPHICTITNESSSHPDNDVHVEFQRRLPVTEDAIHQYHRLTSKILRHKQHVYVPDFSRPSTPSHSTNTSPTLPMTLERDEVTLQQQLFHYQILAPSLVSDIRSYKATYPHHNFDDFYRFYQTSSMMHDIYNGNESPSTVMEFMEETWNICDACLAHDQKPLLRVETEAEKCLTYFESLSASKLCLELLLASLPSLYTMIAYDVSTAIVDLLPSCTEDEDLQMICDGLTDELSSIYRDIQLAIHEMRLESPSAYTNRVDDSCINTNLERSYSPIMMSPSSRNRSISTNSINSNPSTPPPPSSSSSTPSTHDDPIPSSSGGISSAGMSYEQAGLILIDAIERKIYRLEEFLLRYRALIVMLTPPAIDSQGRATSSHIHIDALDIKKLALRLYKHQHITAKSEAEAQILFMLAKNSMTPGSLAYDRASIQGRELSPLRKILILQHHVFDDEEEMIIKREVDDVQPPLNMMGISSSLPDMYHRFVVDIAEDRVRTSTALLHVDE